MTSDEKDKDAVQPEPELPTATEAGLARLRSKDREYREVRYKCMRGSCGAASTVRFFVADPIPQFMNCLTCRGGRGLTDDQMEAKREGMTIVPGSYVSLIEHPDGSETRTPIKEVLTIRESDRIAGQAQARQQGQAPGAAKFTIPPHLKRRQ